MGRIYSWFMSGGTIKIKIYEHGDFVSVTHTDDFIKHFPDVEFTAFHNRKEITSLLFAKLSSCWFYLLLVSLFMFRTVPIYDFS